MTLDRPRSYVERAASRRDVVRVFFKYKFRTFFVLLLSLAVAATYLTFTDEIYEARAKVLVKLGREKATEVSASARGATNFVFQERTQNINNEIEILKSGSLIHKTALALQSELSQSSPREEVTWRAKLRNGLKRTVRYAKGRLDDALCWIGLRKRLTEEQLFLNEVARSLHVENVEDTDVILITFSWSDPAIALRGLDLHISGYLSRHLEVHGTEKSQEFYDAGISVQEDKLRGTEKALAKFTSAGGIANLSLQKEVLIRDIADLEKSRAEILANLEALRIKIDGVRKVHQTTDDWIETQVATSGGSEITDLKRIDESFFELLAERNQLVGGEASSAIDHRIGRLRDQKFEALMRILSAQRATEQSRLATYDRILGTKTRMLASFSERTVPLEQLQRARDIHQDDYLFFRKKAEEFSVFEDLTRLKITSVKVVDPPQLPILPKQPRKSLILALSAVMGLLLGVAYALASELLDHTFKSEADVERVLGVPLLASVPEAPATWNRSGIRSER